MITIAVPMPILASGNVVTDTASWMIYNKKIYVHVKWKLKLEENYTKAYSLIKGKFTKSIKYKLNIHANNMQMKVSYDLFLLINTLEDITFHFEGHKQQEHVVNNLKTDFYNFSHTRGVETPNYLELFKAKVSVMGKFGGEIDTDPRLIKV